MARITPRHGRLVSSPRQVRCCGLIWRHGGAKRTFDHGPGVNAQIAVSQVGLNPRVGAQLQNTHRSDRALNLPQNGHGITLQLAFQTALRIDQDRATFLSIAGDQSPSDVPTQLNRFVAVNIANDVCACANLRAPMV